MRFCICLLALLTITLTVGCTCRSGKCARIKPEMSFPVGQALTAPHYPLSSEEERYVRDLTSRIMGYGKWGGFSPQIVFTNEEGVVVASSPGGLISISRGAIKQLESESQLAFVLAHELAHHLLGHTCSTRPEAELEFEADNLAASMFFRSGFSTRAASLALINAYQGIHYFEKDRRTWAHPKAHDRILNLNSIFASMGDTSVGAYDSLDFQNFRRTIIN